RSRGASHHRERSHGVKERTDLLSGPGSAVTIHLRRCRVESIPSLAFATTPIVKGGRSFHSSRSVNRKLPDPLCFPRKALLRLGRNCGTESVKISKDSEGGQV